MKNIFLLLTIIVLNLATTEAQLFQPQSNELTDKFFPELELESSTPAFQKKRGFTKYQEMIRFLKDLANKHPQNIQINYIGKSQKGKEIPVVYLSKKNTGQEKVKVWIQAAIHGNEPASTEGMLYLTQQLLENKSYEHLLDRLEIAIVPMGNIDGFEQQERMAANGLDMNRDQTKLLIPESVILKKAFSDFAPEVALDFHEYNPFRSDYLKMGRAGYTLPHDVMFLYSGNLNIGPSLREYTSNYFVQNAKKHLEEKGMSTFNYFLPSTTNGYDQYNIGSANARASATSFALTNCVSTLFEVRGVSLGRTSFKRRTLITFYLALSYLESSYADASNLKSTLAKSMLENKRITITSRREGKYENLDFIDMDRNTIVQKRVFTRNALHTKPSKTRKIPTAYLIDENQIEVVKRLQTLGIQVHQLQKEQHVDLEAYKILDYHRDAAKYEGVNRQNVKTAIQKINKSAPEHTFVVFTNQKNRGLLVEVLEPECDNSFVKYGIIPTHLKETLPFYRLEADSATKNMLQENSSLLNTL